MLPIVSNLRISEVAALMGVSDDTVRRYIDQGRLNAIQLDNGRKGVSGRELAETLQDRRPDLKILFMSGYTDDEIVRRGLAQSGSSFLEKPFTPERVAGAIRRALDGMTASDGAHG